MPDTKRDKPFIFTTWLADYLGGAKCRWRNWYKVHYSYKKRPDAPDRAEFLKEWTEKHDAFVARVCARLITDGHEVLTEDAAKVTIRGSSADLVAKPDIFSTHPVRGQLLIECKTGQMRESDRWQLRIYQYAVGLARKTRPTGKVLYENGAEVSSPLQDQATEGIIVNGIKALASGPEPTRTPCYECFKCDIASCPERLEKNDSEVETKEF